MRAQSAYYSSLLAYQVNLARSRLIHKLNKERKRAKARDKFGAGLCCVWSVYSVVCAFGEADGKFHLLSDVCQTQTKLIN